MIFVKIKTKSSINQMTAVTSELPYPYPVHASIAFHIETSHLICTANHMTGFYLKCNTGLKWVTGIIPKIINNM